MSLVWGAPAFCRLFAAFCGEPQAFGTMPKAARYKRALPLFCDKSLRYESNGTLCENFKVCCGRIEFLF
jgi:hypothetical protein